MKRIFPADLVVVEMPPDPRSLPVGSLVPCAPGTYPGCGNCGDPDGVLHLWRNEGWAAKHPKSHWVGSVKVPWELLGIPCPVCRGDQRETWLLDASGLAGMGLAGRQAVSMRLADLRGVKGQIEALEASQRLLGAKATWALFYGDKGVGKTRILMTLVNEWRLKGVWATYTVAERLLAALRSTFDPGSTSGLEEARSRYVRADILAVDEIDRVNWTDWAGEQLFSILNERDMRFRGTYFASNVHPSEWVEKSEPMAALKSRASSGEMVHVSGEDLRPRLQEEFEV